MIATPARRRRRAGRCPARSSSLLAAGRPRLIELLKLGLAYAGRDLGRRCWLVDVVDGGALGDLMDALAGPRRSAPRSPTRRRASPSPRAGSSVSSLLRLVLPAAALGARSGTRRRWSSGAGQGWAKSLFFSTMAIWRNRGAFAVYGLGWFGLWLVLRGGLQPAASALFGGRSASRSWRRRCSLRLLDDLLHQPLVHLRRLLLADDAGTPARRAGSRSHPPLHEDALMNKVAIVTGAGSGIGRASALALLEGRLPGRARRPPRRRARGDRARRRRRSPATPSRADRRHRPGRGQGAVRGDQGGVRPARRAVQQRRHRRAGDPARGADGRAVEDASSTST